MKFFASVDRRVPYALLRWGGGSDCSDRVVFSSPLACVVGNAEPSSASSRSSSFRVLFSFLYSIFTSSFLIVRRLARRSFFNAVAPPTFRLAHINLSI